MGEQSLPEVLYRVKESLPWRVALWQFQRGAKSPHNAIILAQTAVQIIKSFARTVRMKENEPGFGHVEAEGLRGRHPCPDGLWGLAGGEACEEPAGDRDLEC